MSLKVILSLFLLFILVGVVRVFGKIPRSVPTGRKVQSFVIRDVLGILQIEEKWVKLSSFQVESLDVLVTPVEVQCRLSTVSSHTEPSLFVTRRLVDEVFDTTTPLQDQSSDPFTTSFSTRVGRFDFSPWVVLEGRGIGPPGVVRLNEI